MNGINLDPGLRQAFTQQTNQRLLTEAKRARMAKCVITDEVHTNQGNHLTLRLKIKIIVQIIQEAAATIVTIIRSSEIPANA